MRNSLFKTGIIPLVGISCFYAGKFYERTFVCDIHTLEKNFPLNLPGFPLIGNVSAEVPAIKDADLQYREFEFNKPVVNRTSQIMKYGFPGLDNVRSFQDFVLSYDQRNRIAHWVFEHLNKETLKKNEKISRALCKFTEDESVHSYFRALNQDYKGSGFDRGHLAAAGNHQVSQEHVAETFFLSNIAPQVGAGFNRDIWNDLEKYVRKLARIHKNVYVCTGPLFLPRKESDGKAYVKYQVIGQNNVAVPTHFFKVIVIETDDGALEMESYVLPNRVIENGTSIFIFQVPPETIERASGLLFFNRLSKERLRRINNKKL